MLLDKQSMVEYIKHVNDVKFILILIVKIL